MRDKSVYKIADALIFIHPKNISIFVIFDALLDFFIESFFIKNCIIFSEGAKIRVQVLHVCCLEFLSGLLPGVSLVLSEVLFIISAPSQTVYLLVNVDSENSPLDLIKVCDSLYIPGTHIPFLLIERTFFAEIDTGCTALSKFCDFFSHSRTAALFIDSKGTGPGSVSWTLCRTGQYQDFFVYSHLPGDMLKMESCWIRTNAGPLTSLKLSRPFVRLDKPSISKLF